jgi:Na+-driven multidrug efflux pump
MGRIMRERTLAVPELMLIAGTRVALGVGVGLLVARKLGEGVRKGAGWALLSIGALSTIPIVMNVLARPKPAHGS